MIIIRNAGQSDNTITPDYGKLCQTLFQMSLMICYPTFHSQSKPKVGYEHIELAEVMQSVADAPHEQTFLLSMVS